VRGLKDGDVAGLGIFQFPYAFAAIQQDGAVRKIVMVNHGKTVAAINHFAGDTIWFRAWFNHQDFKASFAYSTDGNAFHLIGNKLHLGLGLVWTANRFALFNFCTNDAGVGGFVDFDWFHFSTESREITDSATNQPVFGNSRTNTTVTEKIQPA
jgi:hypothetical protein